MELSDRQLSFGYWWLTHKEQIGKYTRITVFWLVIWWLVMEVILVVRYFYYQQALQIQQAQELSQGGLSSDVRTVKPAVALQLGPSAAKRLITGQFDMWASINNSNTSWWAEVSYEFTVGGQSKGIKTTTVMPGQEKFLWQGGVAGSGQGVSVKLVNTVWHRVKEGERWPINVKISSPTVEPVAGEQVTGIRGAITKFTVTNLSAYGFWEMPIQIVAKRGGQVVGVRETVVKDWMANEEKEVVIVWPLDLSGVSDLMVQVVGNVFDDSVIKR
ncbi:MAG: hypothetical protein V1707_00050 [bacterium]